MKWSEFIKPKKKTYKISMTDRVHPSSKWVESVQGYPFEENTFILKKRGPSWSIVDIECGGLVGWFDDFEELYRIWNDDLKNRVVNFRKTEEYKVMVAVFKSLEEKKDES